MEKINDSYEIALQTLATLKEALNDLKNNTPDNKYYLYICDSTIQRFEYSIDTFWKFIKLYMSNNLNITIEVASPRPILREALNATIITKEEFEILLHGITCRNITSHAYNKELARTIITEIPDFYETMLTVLQRLKS